MARKRSLRHPPAVGKFENRPLGPTNLSHGFSIVYAVLARPIFFGGFRYTRYNRDLESPFLNSLFNSLRN